MAILPKPASSVPIGKVVILLLLHIILTGFVCLIGQREPLFWGLAFLAYTLGVRHAFDLDHIVFIDNAVRKLVQERKPSAGVGFYFALGHSLAVLLLVVALTASIKWLYVEAPGLLAISDKVIPMISGSLLLTIGITNGLVLIPLMKAAFIKSGSAAEQYFDGYPVMNGMLFKWFNRISKWINRQWHVVFFGFLFGLAFDTASEISLISMSAQATRSPFTQIEILMFPVLFAAGMMLIDMLDSMVMNKSYAWAFTNPLKKIHFNLVITSITVVIAIALGLIKLADSLFSNFSWGSGISHILQQAQKANLGYFIVILLLLVWLNSYLFMKGKNNR